MRSAAAAAVALCLLAACTKEQKGPPPSPTRYVGGIQVNEPDHLVWGTQLTRAGFDTVEVTVYAKQGDWDSANLWFEDEEPAVVSEMRLAKTLGLKVVLVLRVALDHAFERNRFLWHGMIHPRDDALDAWFDRYGAFVEKWAAIAARERVDVVGIASEMSALTNTRPIIELPALERYYLDDAKQAEYRAIVKTSGALSSAHLAAAGGGDYVDADAFLTTRSAAWRAWAEVTTSTGAPDSIAAINARRARLEAKWRAVIQRAKARYGGPLTYAANFDQYASVGFWDALDLIGVNAYFPLRDTLGPTDRVTLVAGWRRVFEALHAFRAARGLEQRVLFTELGYTRRAGATAAPWASGVFEVLHLGGRPEVVVWSDRPQRDDERAAAVEALADVAADDDAFAGVLYWKLSTRADHRAIEPFVLVIADKATDPLQAALNRFTSAAKPARVEPP